MQAKLCDCLIVHPLVQIYFRSALTPVFETLRGKAPEDAKREVLVSLKEASPLLPLFLRKVLEGCGQPGHIFYKCFLKKVFDYFFLFGIAHPELTVFLGKEISGLSAKLNEFFEGAEGAAFVRQELLAEETIVCLEPSEEQLMRIAPNFEPLTCVDRSCLRELSSSEGITIGEREVVYVPLPRGTSAGPRPGRDIAHDTLYTVAMRFLVNAAHLKVDSPQKTVMGYFQELYALSAPFGDARLQADLNVLETHLEGGAVSFKDLCDAIERELESDSVNDPLEAVAGYSAQSAYLTKLLKFVQEVPKNALDWIEFNLVLTLAEDFPIDPDIPPKQFVSVFTTMHEELTKAATYQLTFTARRSLFSLLLHRTGVLEKIKSRPGLEAMDREIMEFLKENREALIETEQQSFLEPYKNDPTKLASFIKQYNMAFETDLPFTRLAHLNTGLQILAGLLTLQGIGEIGGDQIVPFAMLATVVAAPPQLASTQAIFSELMAPLVGTMSPLDHVMEYALTQFLSTFEFVIQRMAELTPIK
jgi:hypothetical protein